MQFVSASDCLSRDVELPPSVWQKLLDAGKPMVLTCLDRHQADHPLTHPKLIRVEGRMGIIKPQGHGGREEKHPLEHLRINKARTLQFPGKNVFTEQELIDIIAPAITERVEVDRGMYFQLTPQQYEQFVIMDRGWCQFWAGAAIGFVPDLIAGEDSNRQAAKVEIAAHARKSITKVMKNTEWRKQMSETGLELVTVKRAIEIMRDLKVEFGPDGRNPLLRSLAEAQQVNLDASRTSADAQPPTGIATNQPIIEHSNGQNGNGHRHELNPAANNRLQHLFDSRPIGLTSITTDMPSIDVKDYSHPDARQAWSRKQQAAKNVNDAQTMLAEALSMLTEATKELAAADEHYHAVMQQLVVQPAAIAANFAKLLSGENKNAGAEAPAFSVG